MVAQIKEKNVACASAFAVSFPSLGLLLPAVVGTVNSSSLSLTIGSGNNPVEVALHEESRRRICFLFRSAEFKVPFSRAGERLEDLRTLEREGNSNQNPLTLGLAL